VPNLSDLSIIVCRSLGEGGWGEECKCAYSQTWAASNAGSVRGQRAFDHTTAHRPKGYMYMYHVGIITKRNKFNRG